MNFILNDNTVVNTMKIVAEILNNEYEIESFNLTCFRLFGLKEDYFQEKMYSIFRLMDEHICIVAYLKEFKINGSVCMRISEVGTGFKMQSGGAKEFEAGSYLFLIHYGRDREKYLEKELSSLISIFAGEELLHNECFKIQVMAEGFVQVFPFTFKSGKSHTTIDVDSINKINKSIELINKRKIDDKERIMLSLRWYYKHINQQVEDAFLTLWIAIEILGDCEGSNIAKIKNAFKDMYSMDNNTAGQTFGIGPIQGIRGSLVHKGKMKNLDKKFIEYLRRIYWDLFLYTLGEKCEKYSLKFLQIEGIKISDYHN